MFQYIQRLLDTQMLSPHGICLLWRPELLWTHVISDTVIFSAYMTIPVALAIILRRRSDVPFGWMVGSFALFITACGFTHLMGIWTLWHPDYGAEALVKALTAAASIATAIALWLLIPVAIKLPSPAQLRLLNTELESRVRERDAAIADLVEERAERQKVEEALLQARKLDALGQLTGGVAHDFNNVLHAVQGSVELIRRRADEPSRVERLADLAMSAIERGAALTSQLLAFARRKQLDIRTFFVADLIESLRQMLTHALGPKIVLRFELHTGDIPVIADKTQLELAVLNLVLNARDAAGPEAKIIIETERYLARMDEADLGSGVYVKLTVRDNGPGMPPDVLERAFEPFFTTKPQGQGTGLGLAQVYGFASQVGGAARITSAPGQGTAVSIFIPMADGDHQRVGERTGTISEDSGEAARLYLLVVDDDEHVRRTTVEQLEALGHTVTAAASGADALAHIAERRPDAMIVDYAMPDMNGVDCGQLARERFGMLAIVIATGYADARPLESQLDDNNVVLRKPYSARDLARAIAQAREQVSRE